MSEFGYVRKATFPGVLSAFFVSWYASDAAAIGVHRSVSPLVPMKMAQAQTADEPSEPSSQATAPFGDGRELEDEVPFSELNEALTAARSRLAELTKAAEIAKVAGELREKLQATEAENRQLKSVLSQLQTDNGDLLSAQQTAERRIQELTKSAAEASAEAKRLDEELVAMRWQNSQLGADLSQAEAAAQERTEELGKVRNELGARAESLEAAADETAAEIARLQRELDAAREGALVAERAQAEVAAELAELRQTSEESTADSARLARDLDATITELATTRSELTDQEKAFEEATIALKSADEETDVLRQQLSGSRSEADELRGRLESTEIDLENSLTLNASLERQVEVLRTAAGEATDAARQNLLAVENRIDEINAALASVKAEDLLPGAGGPVIDGGGADTTADRTVGGDGWIPRPSPPRANGNRRLVAPAAPEGGPTGNAKSPLTGTDARPPVTTVSGPTPGVNLASLTSDLPASRRQDAEALLSKLKAAEGERGLSMTVPGELLFAVNSEEIEPAAFDALASVAKLVDLYDERDVLIVGHTDAVGDAGYNQQLSERRAALVKQYFVDNFEIGAERFQVEGKGEQDPISSNATADGRNANRRVEVVILD